MGLVEKIKNAMFKPEGDSKTPAPASFATAPGTIYAPVTGTVVTLDEIHDEAISSGFFGEGLGIVPQVGVVYAPVSGRIGATTVTNHAIGMTMAGGVDILIHVGIDTVEMNGEGFARLVESNQEVKAGTPLLTFDMDAIREAGHDDVVTVVVTNYSDYGNVDNVSDSSTMIAGHPLVKVGDPLLVVTTK